ncbi:MAG: bi-domain-containing oxidoreductase, partial [Elusimicrobiota bacterium]
QVLLHKGKVSVEQVPSPRDHVKNLLIEVSHSLISTGTEMASVHISGASLMTKAKERPQEVAKVIQSIKVRGIKKTFDLVKGKLDEWKPLGYSCSGKVIAVGSEVMGFQVGDRVACAGAGLANHAEVVSVPANLCVKTPTGVSDLQASFVTLGAIALQGVRRADVKLGENSAVIGLGLLGQITVQLLNSAGCKVIGMDMDPNRVAQSLKLGLLKGTSHSSEFELISDNLTAGRGVDSTIITASTSSSEPTRQAFRLTRKKGKIVVVGAVGMDLERSPFYEKEQDFLISCSYGPGRYDSSYELEGNDYPFPYVRWTENRNMQAFLELIEQKKINVDVLAEKIFSIEQAEKAYELLQQEGPKPLAVILSYPSSSFPNVSACPPAGRRVGKALAPRLKISGMTNRIKVGLIGLGNFTKTTHLPNLKALSKECEIIALCASSGASALTVSKQIGVSKIFTDYRELLNDAEVEAVIISTRHDSHATIAIDAIKAGKNVFIEKPLALTMEETQQIEEALAKKDSTQVFMVGFNRRFSPSALSLKKALSKRQGPLMGIFRVNAGALPLDHWTLSPQGGGRLRGEAFHMVDFFQFLVGSKIAEFSILPIQSGNKGVRPDENFSVQIRYEDGSLMTLIYSSLGSSKLSKEHVEVFWDSKSAIIDDFKTLQFYGGAEKNSSGMLDKGHMNCLKTFFEAIKNKNDFPVSLEDLIETTKICIQMDNEVWGKLETSCAES